MTLLAVQGLAKRYGETPVFERVDFGIAAGEFVAVVGESGVGKSTLLNCIAGLDRADAGTATVAGIDVQRLAEPEQARFRRDRLGFVFQAFHVLPHLSVAANVGLPLLLQRAPDDARVEAMLAAVGLGGFGARLPQTLSGGQLQRVAIARALVGEPKLVLADEPTGNLDPENARQVLGLLKTAVRTNGAAAILATHSAQAAAGCDRVYRLTASGLTA